MAFVAPCSTAALRGRQTACVSGRRVGARAARVVPPQIRSTVGIRPAAAGAPSMCAAAAEAPAAGTMTLDEFLAEAATHALSTMRFISITPAAVLETVGRLDYDVTPFDHPTKGRFLTLASVDKMFELHVCVAAVRKITLSTERAKMGGHDLHVVRLRGEDDALVLSMLLQYDPSQGPGHYLAGAVDAFNALREKVGDSVTLRVES